MPGLDTQEQWLGSLSDGLGGPLGNFGFNTCQGTEQASDHAGREDRPDGHPLRGVEGSGGWAPAQGPLALSEC